MPDNLNSLIFTKSIYGKYFDNRGNHKDSEFWMETVIINRRVSDELLQDHFIF